MLLHHKAVALAALGALSARFRRFLEVPLSGVFFERHGLLVRSQNLDWSQYE